LATPLFRECNQAISGISELTDLITLMVSSLATNEHVYSAER